MVTDEKVHFRLGEMVLTIKQMIEVTHPPLITGMSIHNNVITQFNWANYPYKIQMGVIIL